MSWYIDWERVKTVEDVVALLQTANMGIPPGREPHSRILHLCEKNRHEDAMRRENPQRYTIPVQHTRDAVVANLGNLLNQIPDDLMQRTTISANLSRRGELLIGQVVVETGISVQPTPPPQEQPIQGPLPPFRSKE